MQYKSTTIVYIILSFCFSVGSIIFILHNILSQRANIATHGNLALAFWGPIEASAFLLVGGIGGVIFGALAIRSLRQFSFSTKFTKVLILTVAFIGLLAGLAELSVFFYFFISIFIFFASNGWSIY